jgi:hypothetical protein
MLNEIDVLKDVTERLERIGIAYMLTGSMAMSFYTKPRMTRDIDLVVSLTAVSASTMVREFSAAYYISAEAIETAIARQSMFNAVHLESAIKVDFVVRKDETYRLKEFERRQRVSTGVFNVWVVSKEDLILSKLFWARDSRSELQLNDVKNLIAAGADKPYLKAWVAKLGLQDVWKEIAGD